MGITYSNIVCSRCVCWNNRQRDALIHRKKAVRDDWNNGVPDVYLIGVVELMIYPE